MKYSRGAAVLILAALILSGCASHRHENAYHAGDESLPPFLTGPIAVVLTNQNGFSARVVYTLTSPEGVAHSKAGDLLGREGRLLFQPALAIKGKRSRREGGLFFIWDENLHSGYVMSEALQGYAPVPSSVDTATRFVINNEGIREDVNGHPCHRGQALVDLSNGSQVRASLWMADDLGRFPVRIETLDGVNRLTLNFTEVRRQYPAEALFLPPDGFTAYPTSLALMNELIVRDASLVKKNEPVLDDPSDVRPSSFQPQPAFH